MTNRRQFVQKSSLLGIGFLLNKAAGFAMPPLTQNFTSNRPAVADRNFKSAAVEAVI